MHQPTPEAIQAYYDALTPLWHPVLRSVDLGDAPVHVELLGREFVLARLDGEATLLTNVCRHLGASLSLGTIEHGSVLRCRYHGWAYDKTGRCVDIPLRESEKIPAQAAVERFQTQERYGLIWACVAEQPGADLPPYPEFDDERFHQGPLVQHEEWRSSVPRAVMAALDDTHFSYVHPGVLGTAGEPVMPERIGIEPVRMEDGALVSVYRTRIPAGLTANDGGDGGYAELAEVEFVNVATPTSMRNVLHAGVGTTITWNVFLPVSYDRTLTFTQLSRDFDTDPANDQAYEDLNLVIKNQDREIVESQRPWLLPPLDARLMLYVRPEDAPLIKYQRWLEELGVPQI